MSWQFETILDPIGLTEGPAWDGSGLLFTNIPNSRVMRYDAASGAFTVFREGTNRANGLMLDKEGRLYACEGGIPREQGGRRIVRYEPNGSTTVICDHYDAAESGAAAKKSEDAAEGGAAAKKSEDAAEGGAAAKKSEDAAEGGAAAKKSEDAAEGGAAAKKSEDAAEGGAAAKKSEDAAEGGAAAKKSEEKKFNSPNDLAIDSQGRIWFTDPRYGDDRSDMELDHESIFRADPQPDGTWQVVRVTYDTTSPNGLLIAPDQKTLYVAQSKYGDGQQRELRAYPILDDGSVGEYRVLHNFYPHRGIDGMCLDTEGNIIATAGWEVSGPGGMIYVFAPNGRVLETHPLPCQRPTNCTFGDADLRTLYVTSIEGHLIRARTDRQGLLHYPKV